MLTTVFLLLILFQIKHWICDYLLQNRYMLGKFKPGWGFVGPLATHCVVHVVGTLLILCCLPPMAFTKVALILSLDFFVHFIMDRIKASPKYLGRFEALTKKDFPTATLEQLRSNVRFWWSLGLDQMVHHLTHYVIIWMIVD